MNAEEIRNKTKKKLRKIGIELPSSNVPPLIDNIVEKKIRCSEEVYGRSMALFSIICVALSETKKIKLESIEVVNKWLERYGLFDFLTLPEKDLLKRNVGNCDKFISEVESLTALMWSMSLYDMKSIDYVGDDFGEIFPNILKNTNPFTINNEIKTRPNIELLSMLDYYFCIHWKIVESSISGKPLKLPVDSYVIVKRRLALEWILYGEDWEDISLDT